MSANQPSKNEQAAREQRRIGGVAVSELMRQCEQARLVSAFVDRQGQTVMLRCGSLEGAAALTDFVVTFTPKLVAEALAQVAELERLVADAAANTVSSVSYLEATEQLAASRIEAARLREACLDKLDDDAPPALLCRLCNQTNIDWSNGGSPKNLPEPKHESDCPLAATSESAAAWLAEVQRKERERLRGEYAMPTGDESEGFGADHRLAAALALSELHRANRLPDMPNEDFDAIVIYLAQLIANWQVRGVAEVQRKALERARARILEVGDAVLPRVRESMGDHPMFSDAGFKTWMAEFVRTMAAVFADAARDPDLSVDANLDRGLIPEPKEPDCA